MRKVTILLTTGNLANQKVEVYEASSYRVLYEALSMQEADLKLHFASVFAYIILMYNIHSGLNIEELYFPDISPGAKRAYKDNLQRNLYQLPNLIKAVLRNDMPFKTSRGGEKIRVTYMFSVPWHRMERGFGDISHYFVAPFTMHLPSISNTQEISDYENTYNAIATTREIEMELIPPANRINTVYDKMSITVFIARDLLGYGNQWVDQVLKPQLQAIYGVAEKYPDIVTMEVVLYYNPKIKVTADGDKASDSHTINAILKEICNNPVFEPISIIHLIDGEIERTNHNNDYSTYLHMFHLIGFNRRDGDSHNREFLTAVRNMIPLICPKFVFLAWGGSALPNISMQQDYFAHDSSILQHLHNSFKAYERDIGILAFWWYTPALWLQQLSKFFYQEVATQLQGERNVCFSKALRLAQRRIIWEAAQLAFKEALNIGNEYEGIVISLFDNVLFTLDARANPLNPHEQPILKAYTYANPLLINNYCVRRGCPECS